MALKLLRCTSWLALKVFPNLLSNYASRGMHVSLLAKFSSTSLFHSMPTLMVQNLTSLKFLNISKFTTSAPLQATLWQMHKTGPIKKKRKNRNPLGKGVPFAKGIVLKTLIKKPKKPNSANRKCVLVRLSSGKELIAYIPGEGHNLQEHNIVLVRPGRLQDVPGVKCKCVRGKYDLPHVIKKTR